MVELHKFTNNINTELYLWNFNDFFHPRENEHEFPYEIMLFELKKELSYIIAFIPKVLVDEEMEELSFIKKFRFKTFNEDAYDEITTIKYGNYIKKRILSTFLMDDKYLVVISLEVIDENEYSEDYSEDDSEDDRLIERRRTTENSFFKITFNLYRNRLDLFELISNDDNILQVYSNFIDYLFFKAIYLKKDFVVFAYIAYISEISEDFSLVFKLYELNYLYGGNQRARKIIHIEIDNEILIDFIKISDRRLAFICTNCLFDDDPSLGISQTRFLRIGGGLLYILIINILPDFEELIPKFYSYFIGGYIPTFQISGFIYNDFLLFTSTAIRFEDYYNFIFYYLLLLQYASKIIIILTMIIIYQFL